METSPATLPELIAHRGYAGAYPENTLPALAAAIDLGGRYLECDIQLSADLVPVLFHDRTLERQCGQAGEIKDYSLARLREFSAGCPGRFGKRFAGTKIATLAELAALLARHPQVVPFIELKGNSLAHFGTEPFLDRILRELSVLRERAVLISYDIGALNAVRDRGWPRVGAVTDSWPGSENSALLQLAPDYLFCAVAGLPPAGPVNYPGARVAVFEVAEVGQALDLAGRGVELIETFEIAKMLAGLAKAGR